AEGASPSPARHAPVAAPPSIALRTSPIRFRLSVLHLGAAAPTPQVSGDTSWERRDWQVTWGARFRAPQKRCCQTERGVHATISRLLRQRLLRLGHTQPSGRRSRHACSGPRTSWAFTETLERLG